MAMTLRLTDEEHEALRTAAERDGISMQDVARRAVREYLQRATHRERVMAAADHFIEAHAELLDRLGK